jgi:hypothetical protein
MMQIYTSKFFVWFLVFIPAIVLAQTDSSIVEISPKLNDGTIWRQHSEVNSGRLMIAASGIMVLDIMGMMKLKETWYNDKRGKFHAVQWDTDIRRWQQMDKLGHTVHAAFASDFFSKAYRWSGFSANQSIWMGSLTGWLWMLQMEITDGFFVRWGFSYGDLIGNTAGATFSALRQYFPAQLGGLRFKVSYHTSIAYRTNQYYRPEISKIDDYEGITFWLTANLHDMLPKPWQKGYPDILKPFGLAIGHSAKGVARNSLSGRREILLSIDIDITKIPLGPLDDFPIVRFIKDELNFLKIPMPTIRISGNQVFYGVYF